MQVSDFFIDADTYNETQNPIQAWASLVACLESGQLDKLPPEVHAYFCRAGNALLFGESDEKLGKTLANALEFSNKSQLGEIRKELQAREQSIAIFDYRLRNSETLGRLIFEDEVEHDGEWIPVREYEPAISRNEALNALKITASGAEDKTGIQKRHKYYTRNSKRVVESFRRVVFKK